MKRQRFAVDAFKMLHAAFYSMDAKDSAQIRWLFYDISLFSKTFRKFYHCPIINYGKRYVLLFIYLIRIKFNMPVAFKWDAKYAA
ncbi:hypothetical protein D917_07085 [Trichinella nativa]|uniref:Uncharacterized protein n=1 Tax=Trichinella nativa TaxID=6335 RepID=A0A1Y3ETY0_9BILA|nr:hypothetical protein D917_07085 [Trichinella nativa]